MNDMAFSADSATNDGLAAVANMKISNGTIAHFEHDASPTMKISEEQTLEDLPPRSIVKIVLNPAKGSTIHVEVWLPDPENWNGRFVGLGNGGSAGSINSGVLAGSIRDGNAAATTDMGTAPGPDSGIGNQEVWKDFGYRATHLMSVTAKQVIKEFYGKEPVVSYFIGGSTGGQQGLQEAQRYPEDYDGIVANVPAHCRTPLHAYFLWNAQILNKCPFTESQQENVVHAGNEYMARREIPQTAGKIVSDPRCTQEDIEGVIQLSRKKDPSLTEAHAQALQKLFDGPIHSITRERIFSGIPFGSSFDGAYANLYVFEWVFGAQKDLMQINFDKDIDTYTAALAPYLNAENADLSAFEKRGGKLIMFTGSADSVVPYHATLDYYERVIEHFGSLEKALTFSRLYLIPGMSHGSGPGINTLPEAFELLVNWRENNAAPEMILGQRIVEDEIELEIELYPYPSKTGWRSDKGFERIDGPRKGVKRVAERFRPPAAE